MEEIFPEDQSGVVESNSPTVITDLRPRLLTDEDQLIRISASSRPTSEQRDQNRSWEDMPKEWKQVPSDRGSRYRRFVEINAEKDEKDLFTVRHKKEKLISPSNFLESDVRLSTKGLVVSHLAAGFAVALATGAATAAIYTHRHRNQ